MVTMPRPATLSQADVNRVMKVAEKRGMTVRVLPDGSVMIVPKPEPADAPVAYDKEIRL